VELRVEGQHAVDLGRVGVEPLRDQRDGRFGNVAVGLLDPLEDRHQVAGQRQVFIDDLVGFGEVDFFFGLKLFCGWSVGHVPHLL